MTFTLNLDSPDDVARVRMEIGDVDSEAERLSDEMINFHSSENDDVWQVACIACIDTLIGMLNTPGFTADWLKVDPKSAIDQYVKMRSRLEAKFGIGGGTLSYGTKLPTRNGIDGDSSSGDSEYVSS